MTQRFKSIDERNDDAQISVSRGTFHRLKDLAKQQDTSIRALTTKMVVFCMDNLQLIDGVTPPPDTPWNRVEQWLAKISPEDLHRTMGEFWRMKQRIAMIDAVIAMPDASLQSEMDRHRKQSSSGNGAGDNKE
jgi:hypothetical protein